MAYLEDRRRQRITMLIADTRRLIIMGKENITSIRPKLLGLTDIPGDILSVEEVDYIIEKTKDSIYKDFISALNVTVKNMYDDLKNVKHT